MTKNKRRKVTLRVLSVLVLASFVLMSLSVTSLAWWYHEWRYHGTQNWRCATPCGLPSGSNSVWYDYVEHKWACHDASGYCYDTGESRSSCRFYGCAYCYPGPL